MTRNADVEIDDDRAKDDEDYLDFVKNALKKRSRLAPLRMEVYRSIPDSMLNYLCEQLDISKAPGIFVQNPA